jgi:hypothetical protein
MRLTAFLTVQQDIVLAEQAATYKGRSLLTAPRTDPYVRNSRIRLLPRVLDEEPLFRPRVKDARLR